MIEIIFSPDNMIVFAYFSRLKKTTYMKKLLLLLFLATAGITHAQFIQFGVKGGANFANIKSDKIDYSNRTSYHVGALIEIRVFQNMSFQPELLYSVQGAEQSGKPTIDLKYVNVPMMLKFYLISNKLSIEAGPQFGFLVDNNLNNTYEAQEFDFSAGGGVAVDLTKSLFIQARYMVGMSELSKKAEAKNSVFQISLGLKF